MTALKLAAPILDGELPNKPLSSRKRPEQVIKTGWSDEQDEELRRRAADGQSSGVIAEALGKTRSSICGRAHRKGIQLKSVTGKQKARHLNKPVRRGALAWGKKTSFEAVKPTFIAEAVEDIARVQLTELAPHMCRWPVGEPVAGFCGLEQRLGSAYCAGHHARAYQPLKPTDLVRAYRRHL